MRYINSLVSRRVSFLSSIHRFHNERKQLIKNTELSRVKAKFIIDEISKSTNMSTYDVLFQDAVQQGIEKGIEKGVEKGIEIQEHRKNLDFVNSLIISTDFDDEKIATLVCVDVAFVEEQRKLSKS